MSLGLNTSELEETDRNRIAAKIFESWRQKHGSTASYTALLEALKIVSEIEAQQQQGNSK